MRPLNPKSASALCWFALILNGLGLVATALSAQLFFSAIAAFLALIPTLFARKKAQIFGVAVLVLSLMLAVTGYPNYQREMARIQQRVEAAHESVPEVTGQAERQ